MGNCCAKSNRSNSNHVSVSSTASRQQPAQSTHSSRPLPQAPAVPPAEPPVASPPSPASSEPPTTSPLSPLSPLQPSPPPTVSARKFKAVPNLALNVPPIENPVLDLLSDSPEKKAYQQLLSDDATKHCIALYGMGGVGKTTMMCVLGRNKVIRDKFKHGVFFFGLGQDITMPSFIRKLQNLVRSVLPDFLEDFERLAASEDLYDDMITGLTNRLELKRFLLLFDDVWDINSSVCKLVHALCEAVRAHEMKSMKVLLSTRHGDVVDALTWDSGIAVNPHPSDSDKSLLIFCHNACIQPSVIPSLSPKNENALGHILKTCAGLPLALSIAGSAVKQLMDPSSNHCDQDAISEYWPRLERNTRQLADQKIGGRHRGLTSALKTSLQYVEKKWESEKETHKLEDKLRAGEMFESFCIMQKQTCLPFSTIEKLWGVREVKAGVRLLSRNSLVSEVKEGSKVVGVHVHDLVLDMCMDMAKSGGGATKWHTRLLNGYRASLNTSGGAADSGEDEGAGWWKLGSNDKYIVDNIVRHLLGAGQDTEALGLLIDYRWVERMNEDKDRAPFQKVMSELKALQSYIAEDEKAETAKKVIDDIDVVVKAMGLCMVPYCMKNRDECRFQLHGRLRDVESESGIVERLVRSIERDGRLPWARAGPRVLTSGRGLLKRVMDLEDEGESMCVVTGGEEVVVGGKNGKVWVYNGRDGSKKMLLVGHDKEEDVVDMYYHRSSRKIYSCSSRGRVVVWNEHKVLHSVQTEGLGEDERIKCMQVLPERGRVVLGTSDGRLVVIDMMDGSTRARNLFRTVDAHERYVSSLTAGRSEGVVVSESSYGTIRVWDAETFENTGDVLEGHKHGESRVALSDDGRLLASGSYDGTVQVFDLQRRKQLCSCSTDYDHWASCVCVLFSEDASLLYSAYQSDMICVWRLSNGGANLSLVRTLRHSRMRDIRSLCIGDESELFALSRNRVHVWEAREVDSLDEPVHPFLPDVFRIVCSPDGATMLTRNRRSKRLEMRDVCDVSERIDHVVSSVHVSSLGFWPSIFIVSNDRQYIAVSDQWSCIVQVYGASGGLLHRLSDAEQLALDSTSNEEGRPASDAGTGDSLDSAIHKAHVHIGSLCFSEDGCTTSAVAELEILGEHKRWRRIKSKLISWNVSSGKVEEESQVDGESNAPNSTANSGTIAEQQYSALSVDSRGVVTCEHDGRCFIKVTLEDDVEYSYYCPRTCRLWFRKFGEGLFYTDIITGNKQILSSNDPPSLRLLQPPHPRSSRIIMEHTHEDTDEVYDVFISHAGPDKLTIAKLLYDVLVALGLKVFCDIVELRPGDNPPRMLNDAMRTARIAVVILSPEFAARKWTMIELMCFLERFPAHGEREMIIIPVFYRLSLEACKDQKLLAGLMNDTGKNAPAAEGFLERIGKEGHYRMEEIMNALQAVTVMTGIENRVGVTNGDSAKEVAEQQEFVERIKDAIVVALGGVESGRTAGSSSRVEQV